MTAYAIMYVRSAQPHPEVVEYLRQIDATLDPFGGRFLVHGDDFTVVEGSWGVAVIVVEFPDRESAHGWYESAAYRAILHLRTNHIEGDCVLANGVPDGYRGADSLDH
ncbi:DUF1330 domain-containing protein [Streptacidiphilus sp. P02-A3a]|uniref:DUF1330 domain-containing protein n=1 Tax=Streptacidiphilus sp. P02-A3a TaxID=2704468 RepID=UPI0015FB327D|nr:DUF1330 domain-containing protein [Streptacidiphilus sp. P02-A3a]QMU72941.1 DUF1330 domain-containing protein [Streptacidiphilus sp. P02-A3a]